MYHWRHLLIQLRIKKAVTSFCESSESESGTIASSCPYPQKFSPLNIFLQLCRYSSAPFEENILILQDNGRYAITNLGGITLARELSSFPRIERKAIRIIQYEGSGRIRMLNEVTLDKGYAVCMEEALTYFYAMTPTSEDINGAYRETEYAYPPTAIR